MTDIEILAVFHRARLAHAVCKASRVVAEEDYCEIYDAAAAAEKVMADRFGLGEGRKLYRARYPCPD